MINQTLLETPAQRPVTLHTGTPRRSTALVILSGLWLILFFAALFSPPLLDDADATHANAARHMALTGDLVTLKVDGIRYLEKAPLPYWLVALSFRLFGFNTFAAHLPQAIGVLLLALLGYRWAEKAFSPRAAFYTGLATLTSAGIFLFTRYFIPEVLLSLFLSTALYCLLRSLEDRSATTPGTPPKPGGPSFAVSSQRVGYSRDSANRSPSPNSESVISTLSEVEHEGAPAATVEKSASRLSPATHAYLMWAALALAVLTKGLVALVFFFGAAILYLALTGDYKKWRNLKPLTGTLLFLAIAAPWHILAGLRNTGGMNGHGFFWFYFVNEHFLRFLGRRYPKDYNKLPSYLYWTLHLVWLFPWSLFCGVLFRQAAISFSRFNQANPIANRISYWQPFAVVAVGIFLRDTVHVPYLFTVFVAILVFLIYELRQRQLNSPHGTPLLLTSTFTQRTTLLLSLFATLVLIFFSLSTNQEYYTFPAYLPLLILIAAALTQAEQAISAPTPSAPLHPTPYSLPPAFKIAHATFTVLGLAIALTLAYGLWISRHIAFVPDIGDLLAHRNVSNYTLSMASLFDLTGPSFAALRLPATLAAIAFLFGPAAAWLLRTQRRHLAATTTIALTSAVFLIAAHIAFARFAPMLSSKNFAETIQQLEATHSISHQNKVLLYGDQAYGSSIPFYLGRDVSLVDGRSTSMLFGSTFPDAPPIFLTPQNLLNTWGNGDRKILFVPIEKRDEVDRLLGNDKILLKESSGKSLYTDRPLDNPIGRSIGPTTP
ncbi:MAG TPA: glycosyltransferase family 39 protein [Edaphobacter sp.]|nr:glycosyltransferase family 39 protein [Edaphobacter sp.]